jgi:hypothetical protein
MSGRVYSISFSGVTVTTSGGDADLFELAPATQKPCRLLGLMLAVSSEVGDAAEEILNIKVMRLPATVTSGNGTSVTPRPINTGDSVAGAACEYNGATVATTTGTAVDLHCDAFNVRSGYQFWWTPETTPTIVNAEAAVVRMTSTVADDVTMSGTLYFEELG